MSSYNLGEATISFGEDGVSIIVNLSKDGDRFCARIGSNIQEGLAAFDTTLIGAIHELKLILCNQHAGES